MTVSKISKVKRWKEGGATNALERTSLDEL
jgi:hypothetical protein